MTTDDDDSPDHDDSWATAVRAIRPAHLSMPWQNLNTPLIIQPDHDEPHLANPDGMSLLLADRSQQMTMLGRQVTG